MDTNCLYGIPFRAEKDDEPRYANVILLQPGFGKKLNNVIGLIKKKFPELSEQEVIDKAKKNAVLFTAISFKNAVKEKIEFEKLGAIIEIEPVW